MLMDAYDLLIESLIDAGTLSSPAIIDAFRHVRRKDFVCADDRARAAADHPLSIGYGQTISQPTTVAFMLELLQVHPSHHVLDVGSGSGWTTALLGQLVGPNGRVTGVELVPELVTFGRENIASYDMPWIAIMQANHQLGWSPLAPYDRILVSAAADTIPRELLAQLKDGGIAVLPVRDGICKVCKNDETIVETFQGFSFVPLITKRE